MLPVIKRGNKVDLTSAVSTLHNTVGSSLYKEEEGGGRGRGGGGGGGGGRGSILNRPLATPLRLHVLVERPPHYRPSQTK